MPMTWPTATEYVEAIQNPRTCFKQNDLQDGTPAIDRLGLPFVSSGQFAYVFKLQYVTGTASAIRCFRGFIGGREERYKAIDQYLDSVVIPALPNFEYDVQGILVGPCRYPILVMEWIDGPTLDVYIEAALQKSTLLSYLADQWIRVVGSLKAARVAHGDLQHGNIIVQNNLLRLVDLDGMFVPSMLHASAYELGHRHYQHPLRDHTHFSEDLDNFSALVIHVSLISLAERPDLWATFHDENLIFTRADFLNPSSSPLFLEIKKIGGEPKRLAEILEKACTSPLLKTPSLSDLVSSKSKLPAWMVAPAGAVITTRTREVIPGQQLSGAASSIPSRQSGVQPAQPLSKSNPIIYGQIAIPPVGGVGAINWTRVRRDTFSISMKFGLAGLLLAWVWFPMLAGIYRDMGFQVDSNVLTIWTYVLGSMAFGFVKAVQNARGSVRSTSYKPTPATSSTPYSPAPMPTSSVPVRLPRSPSYQQPTKSAYSLVVVASKARLIYHRPTCEWARKISARNKVSFGSTAQAQSAGYRRCNVCLP